MIDWDGGKVCGLLGGGGGDVVKAKTEVETNFWEIGGEWKEFVRRRTNWG